MADPESRLRGAGLRVTPQRLAVLAVLDRAGRENAHLLVAEVIERSREILGRVSPQTVYACLEALVEGGLARRVALPGSAARFESWTGAGHEHLACRRCARLVNVVAMEPADTGERPAHGPAPSDERRGFRIDYTDVMHVGLCERCRGPRR